jgi:hypothetical protein
MRPARLLDFVAVLAGYSRRRLVEKLEREPGSKAHLRLRR